MRVPECGRVARPVQRTGAPPDARRLGRRGLGQRRDIATRADPVIPGRHSGPGWPQESTPKRYHLDFYVDDLDSAEAQCVELGATRPAHQPNPERWRVLLDPSGHPFDICLRS